MKYRLLFLLLLFASKIVAQEGNAEKIYRNATDAVVKIFTYHDDGTMHGQGSGVIIKQYGWIVTNYHNLGDATSIFAEHKGKSIKLDSVIAMDPIKDIMILQLSKDIGSKEYSEIPSIKLVNSDNLRVGQRIYAIGSPMGFENTITEGIISGLRTSFDSTRSFIQVSAPISSGSSGGAILDAKGNLIGISTMVITGETVQNLNFALPINDVIAASKILTNTKWISGTETANNYSQKGYSEYKGRNYLTAIINYEKALKLSSKEEARNTYYYMGLCYRKLGNSDKAIENFYKSLEIAKTADAYVGLGTTFTESESFDKAIENYKKAIEINGSSSEAYIGLGIVYFYKNDLKKSVDYLESAIKVNPKNHSTYYMLGKIALLGESYDFAITMFEQALKFKPNHAESYYKLAEVYLKKGQTEEAIKYQQKAYQLNPELRGKKF